MEQPDKRISFALFFGFLTLYIYTASNGVAPYRDTGEMAVLLTTLGVGHPPGYALYTVLGKVITDLIPFGSEGYRVNLFSGLFGAGALVFLYLTLRVWLDRWASSMATAAFGLSNPFWELCNLAEMYSLGIFWVTLLLYAAFSLRNPYLVSFLIPLGLGVRMDLMLMIPLFVLWFGFLIKVRPNWTCLLFFGLGLSIFLYMPLRSFQDPVVDWANPESFGALFKSVSRKSYGGTLDLLSLSYKKGENFLINISLYLRHFVRYFGFWWALLALVGFWAMKKSHPKIFLFFIGAFLITGPVFLFLANMPPNPHSVAIIEAAYPVPHLLLAIFMAFGFSFVLKFLWVKRASLVLLPCLLLIQGAHGYDLASKRDNFFTRDYIENVFRSTPKGAVLVFHEDVQLFSLWEAQLLHKRRPDVTLVATGLSGSPWYWDMLERWGTAQAPFVSLKEPKGWSQMKRRIGDRSLVVGLETTVPPAAQVKIKSQGLLIELFNSEPVNRPLDLDRLDSLGVFRGRYKYGVSADFFTSDLVSDYARAYYWAGANAMEKEDYETASYLFARSESLEPLFPRPTINQGYMLFQKGQFQDAFVVYQKAIRKYKNMLMMAEEYKSLPDVVQGLKRDLASGYVYAGAAVERLGQLDQARRHYLTATSIYPDAQAHYNIAVSYWKKDWDKVIYHMDQALRINPQMARAKSYLQQARYRQRQPKETP